MEAREDTINASMGKTNQLQLLSGERTVGQRNLGSLEEPSIMAWDRLHF